MKTTFICKHLVYAINQTIFFTYEWFWFEIPESYLIKQLAFNSGLHNIQPARAIMTPNAWNEPNA